jgi:hypothetical protein
VSYCRISDDESIQRHYEEARRNGTSHSLAEMFALGAAPTVQTDATFMRGTANGRQFQGNAEKFGDAYAKIARKRGQNVTGKKYLSGLARFPGDPEAWVDGRGDVQRVLEKRGWESEGSVNVKSRCPEAPRPTIDVADDILNEEVQRIVESSPEPIKDRRELKEQVRQKRKRK